MLFRSYLKNASMDAVYEIFEASDGLILGTPVYYNSVSSQMKLMIDRSYCLAKTAFDKGKNLMSRLMKKP